MRNDKILAVYGVILAAQSLNKEEELKGYTTITKKAKYEI
jgi:hypothetical protein